MAYQFTPEANTIVTFRNHPMKNEARSKREGRPIFDDMEIVEIRQAADRQSTKVFPAAEVCDVDPDTGEQITYAMRFADQFKRFRSGKTQTVDGTPLSEAPFLTEAKRSELKALGVLTVESLASLDGQNLKNIGTGGRELKTQAQAYMDNASGSANVVRLAGENEFYKAEIERLKAQLLDQGAKTEPEAVAEADDAADQPAGNNAGPEFEKMTNDELKDYIQDRTGQRPRGNPGKDSLVASAQELSRVA